MKIIVLLFALCLGACGVDYKGTQVRGECQEDGVSLGDACSDDGEPDLGEPDFEENCENNCDEPPSDVEYRFLLIEDTTSLVGGPFPGLDLDSIALAKADGSVFYPTYIDDFNLVSSENMAINPESILGPPDDDCDVDAARFVALGGMGGFVVISFTIRNIDVVIESGDHLIIYDVSEDDCFDGGFNEYDYNSYDMSVAETLQLAVDGEAVWIGSVSGSGEVTFPVTGL